jgi:1-deoxy-D-xylulose-5-phosphate reductoisomerase
MPVSTLSSVKSVAVLGATGSIGVQALEIVRGHPGLAACALSAHSSADELVAAARVHGVDRIALVDETAAARAAQLFEGEVLAGRAGQLQLVAESGADVVLNAIVGAAGLEATIAAMEAGADVALANKESLVAGGELVTAAARRAGRLLLPVDSEHSALWQCLAGAASETVAALVLTASGGPFRGRSIAELEEITPDQALAHPTWDMGAKITVDSATLMNKGLELIEAHHLFGVPYSQIEVVVHPQSVVHALVRFRDGALLAHLGLPDMRVPISYALTYPERAATPAEPLDLGTALTLAFEPPDLDVFRCLALARTAGEAGGTAPCLLNAANEVAVAAFLAGSLPLTGIPTVVESVLEAVDAEQVESLEQVQVADHRARELAGRLIGAAV